MHIELNMHIHAGSHRGSNTYLHGTRRGVATTFRPYIRTWRLEREGEMLIIAELVPSVSYKPEARELAG